MDTHEQTETTVISGLNHNQPSSSKKEIWVRCLAIGIAYLMLMAPITVLIYRVISETLYLPDQLFFAFGFIVVLLISAVSVISYMFIKDVKIEYMFLVASLSIGLSYCLIFVPDGAPDEIVHYTTTYDYSNKLLGVNQGVDPNGLLMRNCDARMRDFLDRTFHPLDLQTTELVEVYVSDEKR